MVSYLTNCSQFADYTSAFIEGYILPEMTEIFNDAVIFLYQFIYVYV